MKYRLSQIAAVVGGRFSGTDCEVQSVVTDSRSLTCELGSGPVFVAMCGANHDSHAFVAQMYARGVRAFMVERPLEALPECGYVVVENAIAALQCLAAYHRAQFRGTVVGITGSNGKTVLMVVHELNLAAKYCSRILLLGEGKLLADDTPERVFTEALLSRAYSADIAVSRNPLNNNLEITTRVDEASKEKDAALLKKICCE